MVKCFKYICRANFFFCLIFANIEFCTCFINYESILLGVEHLGSMMYENFNSYVTCSLSECCSVNEKGKGWITHDVTDLAYTLKKRLHGQHLSKKVIVRAFTSHFSTRTPSKALVLSFHGWTGSGKNYAARIIAESFYRKGLKSKFVHVFVSTVHFPHEEKADIYKLQLQDWIRGNVSLCERTLFIFDEIDKMPLKTIDGIKPFIDHHDSIFGVDFRKSVFIFLSNTGGREINWKMLQEWRKGRNRNEITFEEFEPLIQKGAFNEIGGLHHSDIIQHSLIDFYVPFLPMEQTHVKLCIEDEMKRREIEPQEFSAIMKKVMEKMMFFPPENRLFSTKGCKSVSSLVGYFTVEGYVEQMFKEL